ncbi:MAG: indolepyruvate ferredoxin oxidoreductase family protein, partial [Pseudomonadota bacterium]
MKHANVSLGDRFDLDSEQVLLNGTQALVRLMVTQKWRDAQAGKNTAGYVSGYRGSPLGGVDSTFHRAEKELTASDVIFEPALNEDLGATAIWGAQYASLRPTAKYDGVYGLWYGKGPGVDRTGDAFRHANHCGTLPWGGAIAAMGDDHTGESSTLLHQTDHAMADWKMPVFAPAGVQEIIDYGVHGYGLSRYASLWCGLKCLKDTIESTAVIDGRPDRVKIVRPNYDMPEGAIELKPMPSPHDMENAMLDHKMGAALAYIRANNLNQRVRGQAGAKIGVITAGKNWLDVAHALDLLGIDDEAAKRMGLTVIKLAVTWPVEPEGLKEWAAGLDLIVVVEEKRAFIEPQIKEILYGTPNQPRVIGKHDEDGEILFPEKMAISPVDVALKLGGILFDEGIAGEVATRRIAA